MFVKNFMQTDVLTVSSDDSIYDALKLLKDHNFRRMPVVDNGKLIGIVTRKAIREASPSKATSLSVHELNYLLSKMCVADVMKKNVITTTGDTPIEEAGLTMHRKQIGGLPVMEGDKMVGYISSNDLFRAIVMINGLDKPIARIIVAVKPDGWQDAVSKCSEIIKSTGCEFKMMSLMRTEDENKRHLIMRFKSPNGLDPTISAIKQAGFDVVSVLENIKLV